MTIRRREAERLGRARDATGTVSRGEDEDAEAPGADTIESDRETEGSSSGDPLLGSRIIGGKSGIWLGGTDAAGPFRAATDRLVPMAGAFRFAQLKCEPGRLAAVRISEPAYGQSRAVAVDLFMDAVEPFSEGGA